MNMTPQEYQQYVKQKAKKSPLLKDTCPGLCSGRGHLRWWAS